MIFSKLSSFSYFPSSSIFFGNLDLTSPNINEFLYQAKDYDFLDDFKSQSKEEEDEEQDEEDQKSSKERCQMCKKNIKI